MNRIEVKVILALAVLVFANIVVSFFSFRIDLTADQRYTLSDATKDVLTSIDEPLTIKGYISDDVNAEFDNHADEVVSMLDEYRALSGGNIEIEIIDPTTTDELKQEAQMAGVQPLNATSSDENKLEQQLAFLGLVFEYADQTDVIPFVPINRSIEYPVTRSIKKVAYTDKPKLGLVTGHGETPLTQMRQAQEEAAINYQIEEVTLDGGNLSEFEALVIINPVDSMNSLELKSLDDYYSNGGKLFISYTNANVNLGGGQGQPPMATKRDIPLESWLNQKGISIEDAMVIDAKAGQIMVNQGMFTLPVNFYYFPAISSFSEHPISKDLKVMLLQFASQISYSGSGNFTPLAHTSEMSGSESLPIMFDINKQWQESDFTGSSLAVAGALEDGDKRMVVVTNGDIIKNGEGQQAQQLQPDNINFFVNSVDWLTQNTALMSLRNEGFDYYPIKEDVATSDGWKLFYKLTNFLLPLILVSIYGIVRFQVKRAKRLKWKAMTRD